MIVNGKQNSFLASQTSTQEKYEREILPAHGKPGLIEEYEEYMNYDAAKLKSLGIEECSIISLRLTQYSIFLQRCYNRDKSKLTAIKAEITRCIAPHAHNYQGQWELQREQATEDNDYTKELRKTMLTLEQRTERLYGMAASFKSLADQFKNLQFSKIKERD
jgi:hypothetical protein